MLVQRFLRSGENNPHHFCQLMSAPSLSAVVITKKKLQELVDVKFLQVVGQEEKNALPRQAPARTVPSQWFYSTPGRFESDWMYIPKIRAYRLGPPSSCSHPGIHVVFIYPRLLNVATPPCIRRLLLGYFPVVEEPHHLLVC